MIIHNILSQGQWINSQIDFLLFLQNFRELTHGIFDNFFIFISATVETYIPLIVITTIYWCINNEKGFYILLCNAYGTVFYHFFKIIACVYRPWILDSRIQPVKASIELAKGYSFPSGHTTLAVTIYGAIAFIFKNIFLRIFLVFLVLTVAFSRNYLGVHTPQDIVFAILMSIIILFGTDKLLKWENTGKNKDFYILFFSNIFIFGLMIFTAFKTYPIDYLQGKIVYDAKIEVIPTVFKNMGYALGLINGLFLCKRFVKFDAKNGSFFEKLLRLLIGLSVIFASFNPIRKFFKTIMHDCWGDFTTLLILGLFITLIYPFIFKKSQEFILKFIKK